ncbi:hypothetical protein [Azorhizobium doebereinerae]|uniref:hypothetical protein n=1 Tax=Azorhizobium doebereinerae TaxID=281091 RepID=UPI0003F94336|nr:hypothetical protein [Azorhizobium doebereinerae]
MRRSRLPLLILGFALVQPLLLPAAAAAAEGSGCAAAAWPLEAEGARLQAAGLPRLASGATLAADSPTAFALALVPAGEAGLPTPPERASGAGFAGFVRLAPPRQDGVLQITLDQGAWIDLVQDGKPLKPTAFTGVRDCPLARKSVRFSLKAGDAPVLLQVSGAAADTLRLALTAAP